MMIVGPLHYRDLHGLHSSISSFLVLCCINLDLSFMQSFATWSHAAAAGRRCFFLSLDFTSCSVGYSVGIYSHVALVPQRAETSSTRPQFTSSGDAKIPGVPCGYPPDAAQMKVDPRPSCTVMCGAFLPQISLISTAAKIDPTLRELLNQASSPYSCHLDARHQQTPRVAKIPATVHTCDRIIRSGCTACW